MEGGVQGTGSMQDTKGPLPARALAVELLLQSHTRATLLGVLWLVWPSSSAVAVPCFVMRALGNENAEER